MRLPSHETGLDLADSLHSPVTVTKPFDRVLRARLRLPLRKTPKGMILDSQRPGIRGIVN
jgi:hypothetical protein